MYFCIVQKENIRISSKRYHYDAKQGQRDKIAEQLSRVFKYDEEIDRNRIAEEIGEMPSPKGTTWNAYFHHRLRMMADGIQTYTTRRYARLQLDKHIEWHRAIDKMANQLVCGMPAILFIGAGKWSPNSPISIRKYVRVPGTHKLVAAIQKRGDCFVIMVDEWKTSQLCGRCFGPFPRWTYHKRYKKCENCHPNPILHLPTQIVTNVSKRDLQLQRTIVKEWQLMAYMGDPIAAQLVESDTGRLVPRKTRFHKTWQPNAPGNGDANNADRPQPILKTVWHRDISAAKLILYKGKVYLKLNSKPLHKHLNYFVYYRTLSTLWFADTSSIG